MGRKEARRFLGLGGLVVLAWLASPSGAWANTDVTISSAATSASYGVFPADCANFAAPTGNTANINNAELESCLALGNIQVSTSSAGANPGTITVQNGVAWTPGATGNLTLNAGSSVTFNAAVDSTPGTGGLSITANGPVTQAAPLTISGNTSASAGGSPITLTNASNDFSGAVSLTNSGSNDASIQDSNALQLGTSSVGGNLTATASGAVTQNSALTVTGSSSFDAGSSSITLAAANDFGGAVNLLSTSDATVNDVNGLTLGAVHIGGNLTAIASGDVTQSNSANVNVAGVTTISPGAANNVDLDVVSGNDLNQLNVPSAHNVSVLDTVGGIVLAGIAASNNVTVDAAGGAAGGSITQTSPVTAPGTMTAGEDTTAGHNVVLTAAANDFGTFTSNNATDVSVNDANALVLGGASPSDALSVTAHGPITQSGILQAPTLATFDAEGTSSDITLGLANSLPHLRLTAHNASVTAGGAGIALGASTIANNLTLNATGGPITQTATLAVPGAASFTSPAGTTLADPANNFSTLSVSGSDGTVTDANGVVLGASTLAGGLRLTAGGAVTQSGALNFAGSGSVDATGHDVTLPNPSNSFALLAIPSAHDAVIGATGNVGLGAVSTAGDLTVVDGAGDIVASQAISVGGNATLDAAAGNDVTAPSGGNDFGGTVTANGRNAIVSAQGALTFSGTTLAGTLQAAATSIAQANPIAVGGAATLTSGAGPIALTAAANDFGGTVKLGTGGGQNATITDADNLTIGQSDVGGNLVATAAKVLTVPASTTVGSTGTATLVSDAQSPVKPKIGNGGVDIGAGAKINALSGPVAIYTAKRSQNSIDPSATFNGATFKPGPLFIDTDREVWGTYYPSGSAVSPFTIFYKDKGTAAPQTKLKHPKKRWVTSRRHATVKYAFTSPTPHALFLCKLDRRPLRLCKSPFHASVKTGKHKFLVRAEVGTVVDPTAAKVKFRVVRK